MFYKRQRPAAVLGQNIWVPDPFPSSFPALPLQVGPLKYSWEPGGQL